MTKHEIKHCKSAIRYNTLCTSMCCEVHSSSACLDHLRYYPREKYILLTLFFTRSSFLKANEWINSYT